MTRTMQQTAPYPEILESLVVRLRYRPGWRFQLLDIERDPEDTHGAAAGGLTFIVTTLTHNSYDPKLQEPWAWKNEPDYRVNHYFIVPAATYNEQSWRRWLFDCICKVEVHEASEFFALRGACGCDARGGERRHDEDCPALKSPRPFAPTHGPGDDPYVVHEYADDVQARTSFKGIVKETP